MDFGNAGYLFFMSLFVAVSKNTFPYIVVDAFAKAVEMIVNQKRRAIFKVEK